MKFINASSVNKRALKLMLAGGNYITLVIATIICFSAAMLPYAVFSVLDVFVFKWFSTLMLILLEFAIFAPTLLGVRKIALLASKGKKADIGELFFAFESVGGYLRSIALSAILTVKLILPVAAAFAVGSCCSWLFEMTGLSWGASRTLSGCLAAVAFVFSFLLLSRFYGICYFALSHKACEMNVMQAIKDSAFVCKKRKLFIFESKIRLLPMIIVSAALVLIPLVLFALPYSMISYNYRCAVLEDMRREEASEVAPTKDGSEENDAVAEPVTEDSETATEELLPNESAARTDGIN